MLNEGDEDVYAAGTGLLIGDLALEKSGEILAETAIGLLCCSGENLLHWENFGAVR